MEEKNYNVTITKYINRTYHVTAKSEDAACEKADQELIADISSALWNCDYEIEEEKEE